MYKKTLLFLLFMHLPFLLFSQNWLSPEEEAWVEKNKEKTFLIGFDPNARMEYFLLHGKEYGVILDLTAHLSTELGLTVIPDGNRSWGEALEGLQTGEIDILFGANATEERQETMLFTSPLYTVPYSLLARKDSDIHVIGDLDKKTVGFISGDMIIDLFPEKYGKIYYIPVIFHNQIDALEALDNGQISAVITSGGIVVHDYLQDYQTLTEVRSLNKFTSDMTLSVRKDNSILIGILDQYIARYSSILDEFIQAARYKFNYRIMNLTPAEVKWIRKDGTAAIGVTKDYLPFEYMEEEQFKGICGALIREISSKTGIQFIPVHNEFDYLYDQAIQGNIHIMNIAQTQERNEFFLFTRPFSKERDIIYGLRKSPVVEDIYDFQDATVAVIKGYWHKELLEMNSPETRILIMNNLKDSMKAVIRGQADYLIENPSVMRYFIEEWDYHELVEKGLTSHNSYLSFGITRSKPELASIMDKTLGFIDLEDTIYKGYSEVPHSNKRNRILIQLVFIVLLLLFLSLLGLFTYKQTKALIESRIAHNRMKEKEELMYRDPMTGIYNRHYLYHKVEPFIDKWDYPQSVIICDLNNLKITNDKYGHSYGDKLLSQFAEILSECFQTEDILIRQGGDEFMILIQGKSKEDAAEMARYMEMTLKTKRIPIDKEGKEFIVPSTAWGLASRSSRSEEDFENLLIQADNEMYKHKRKCKKH